MSAYVGCETEINDLESLIESLVEIGVQREKIEVHDVAQTLHGYQGDVRQQKAHVVVRRRAVGAASNDIGFERMEDGRYKTWVSEYDSMKGLGKQIASGRLLATYAKTRVLKEATRRRAKSVTCKEENGRTRIRIKI
jgi:hypothetical protein